MHLQCFSSWVLSEKFVQLNLNDLEFLIRLVRSILCLQLPFTTYAFRAYQVSLLGLTLLMEESKFDLQNCYSCNYIYNSKKKLWLYNGRLLLFILVRHTNNKNVRSQRSIILRLKKSLQLCMCERKENVCGHLRNRSTINIWVHPQWCCISKDHPFFRSESFQVF